MAGHLIQLASQENGRWTRRREPRWRLQSDHAFQRPGTTRSRQVRKSPGQFKGCRPVLFRVQPLLNMLTLPTSQANGCTNAPLCPMSCPQRKMSRDLEGNRPTGCVSLTVAVVLIHLYRQTPCQSHNRNSCRPLIPTVAAEERNKVRWPAKDLNGLWVVSH